MLINSDDIADSKSKAQLCFLQVLSDGLADHLIMDVLHHAAGTTPPDTPRSSPGVDTVAAAAIDALQDRSVSLWELSKQEREPAAVQFPYSMLQCGVLYSDLLWQHLEAPSQAARWYHLLLDHLAALTAIHQRRGECASLQETDSNARCWLSSGRFQADNSFYRSLYWKDQATSIGEATTQFAKALRLVPNRANDLGLFYITSVVRCCEDAEQTATITGPILEQLSDVAMHVFMQDEDLWEADAICEWGDGLLKVLAVQEERWVEGECMYKLPCAARFAYAALLVTQPKHVKCLLGLGFVLETYFFDVVEAEKCYRTALEEEPDNYQVALRLGGLRAQLGELEDAQVWFTEAIAKEENVETLHAYAAFLHKNDNVVDAETQYNLAMELDSWHLPTLVGLARLLSTQSGAKGKEQLDHLVDLFIRALTVAQGTPYNQKSHVEALLSYAIHVVKEHGVHDSAEQFLNQALDINPKHSASLLALAQLHRTHTGDLQKSEALYMRAMEVDPSHSGSLHGLGCVRHKELKHDEAKLLFLSALELEDDHLPSINKMACILQEQKEYPAAEGWYERAISVAPSNADAHADLALFYSSTKQATKSLPSFRTAIRLEPFSPSVIYEFGLVLRGEGLTDEETELYRVAVEQAIWLHPQQRPMQYMRGLEAKPWWAVGSIDGLIGVENKFSAILAECSQLMALNLLAHYDSRACVAGEWKDYTLIKNGKRVEDHCKQCPETMAAVLAVPGLSTVTLGSVYFSCLMPGTHLRPHCGPTNGRLRVHLGCIVPEAPNAPWIRVADDTRSWEVGKCLVFDDSFEHEVRNFEQLRIALIFDLWHPQLNTDNARADMLKHKDYD